eukprot:4532262-Alexandrium_andersonii.AAC.1
MKPLGERASEGYRSWVRTTDYGSHQPRGRSRVGRQRPAGRGCGLSLAEGPLLRGAGLVLGPLGHRWAARAAT